MTGNQIPELFGAAEADAAAHVAGMAAVETEDARNAARVPAAATDERIAGPIATSTWIPADTVFHGWSGSRCYRW